MMFLFAGLVRSRDGSHLSPNSQPYISLPSPNIQTAKVGLFRPTLDLRLWKAQCTDRLRSVTHKQIAFLGPLHFRHSRNSSDWSIALVMWLALIQSEALAVTIPGLENCRRQKSSGLNSSTILPSIHDGSTGFSRHSTLTIFLFLKKTFQNSHFQTWSGEMPWLNYNLFKIQLNLLV